MSIDKEELFDGPIDAFDLDAFRVFGESRSFVTAARALGITQPAAFLRVKKLAASLGTQLYARKGRDLVLTEAGNRTLAHAREVHAASRSLRQSLAFGEAAPEVVLATGEGALLTLLGPSLARFAHGRARLRVQVLDASATLAAVRDGAAHVGVLPLDAVPEDLHARVLGRVPFVVVMPRRHALARRRSVRAEDLNGVPLVLPPPGKPHRGAVERFLSAASIEPVVGAEAMGWTVLAKLAALGIGVAIVPDRTALPRGAVARRLTHFPELTYRVVRRKRAAVPEHVEAFFEALRGAPGSR